MNKLLLGRNDFKLKENVNIPVWWDAASLINPHIMICGKSGTGKSHTLTRLIEQVVQNWGVDFERYHNLDVHGDLIVAGESRVEFSGATRYGYNPLVLDTNPRSGGVLRQVNFIISIINQTARKVQDKQQAALRELIIDVYGLHGIYEDRPHTWQKKEITEKLRKEIWDGRRFSELKEYYPTLDDVIGFGERKLKQMYGGFNANDVGSKAIGKLEEMNRAGQRLLGSSTKYGKQFTAEEKEQAKKQLDVAKEKFLEKAKEYADSLETGREFDDLIKYDSKDVLKGVLDRLKNLRAIGIFNANPPPFDPAATVWSYDLTSLSAEEQVIFCNLRAQYIFRRRKLSGERSSVAEIIGADEAHLLFNDEPDNIFNKISLEARKFGLALWSASQSPTAFPEDILTTVGTKILLGIDSFFWGAACKKLNIEESVLKFITPRKTMAVSMDVKGKVSSKFVSVNVEAVN